MGKNIRTIRTLVGQQNEYQTKKRIAEALATKWEKTGLLQGIEDQNQKSNMALLLQNQASELLKEASETGNIQGSQEWSGVALPLVRKVFGQIASKDFVSVQPMTLPSGLVFYINFKYGTTKPGYEQNSSRQNLRDYWDTYWDDSVYGRTYGNGAPSGGLFGAGRYSYSQNMISASLTGTITSASTTAADLHYDDSLNTASFYTVKFNVDAITGSVDRHAVRSFGLTSASLQVPIVPEFTAWSGSNYIQFVIDSASGVPMTAIGSASLCKIWFSQQPTAITRGDFQFRQTSTVDSTPETVYDNTNAVFNIPQLELEFASMPITAKTRKLKAVWTPQIAQDLNKYQNVDAEAELTAMLSQHISVEIDLQILDMLMMNADTTAYWSAKPGFEWNGSSGFAQLSNYVVANKSEWYQTLGIKVQSISAAIHQKTMRGGANFLVCSPRVAVIFESMAGFNAANYTNANQFAMGVQQIGTINGKINIYKNPYMLENTILVGYRGSSFLQTGAVFAPYVPLIMTPLIYDPDTFQPRKGVMTRYAKQMVRPQFYGLIRIGGMNTV